MTDHANLFNRSGTLYRRPGTNLWQHQKMIISRDTLSPEDPGETVALCWIAAREKIGAKLTVLIIFSTVVLNVARGMKGGNAKNAGPIGNRWESGTACSGRMIRYWNLF